MSTEFDLWPQILPWLPFAVAIVVGWNGHKLQTLPFLLATAAFGLWFGVINPLAVFLFSLFLSGAMLLPRLPAGLKALGSGFLILACLVLGFDLMPGATRLTVAYNVQTGSGSIPFDYQIGLAKPLIFFMLLFALPGFLKPVAKQNFRYWVAALITLSGLFAFASLARILQLEFSIPNWLPIFLIGNLLLTCLPEEALFRGYIQRGLSGRVGAWPAILIASIVFGISHIGSGVDFMVLASLAGLAFGLVYQFSGGLRSAVFLHFGFNIVHLVFFTYPASIG